MPDQQALGDFIRERRLALGFSAGQLAMRLHSTAAVVRTWERGHDPVPDDAMAGLAELLGVDESELRSLQPAAAEAEAPVEKPSTPAPAVEATKPAPAAEPPQTEPEGVPAAPTGEPATAGKGNGKVEQAPVVGHTPGLGVDPGLLEAPTEAIEPVRAVRTATATRPAPDTRRDPATAATSSPGSVEPVAVDVDGSVPEWLGPLRFLFDPSKPYLYWARAIGTIIGLYIVLRVFGFALDGLIDAIGEFWDSFSTPDPASEDVVTSLGLLGLGLPV